MQWLGILFSWCPQVVLESAALIPYLPKMPELAFLVNSELSGGFTATWKTVSSHNTDIVKWLSS